MILGSCAVKSCKNTKIGVFTGLCKPHYDQMIHSRGVFKGIPFVKKRTKKDPNEFIVEGDICKIILFDVAGNKKAETIIDIEDYERCKQHKWHGVVDRKGKIRAYCKNKDVGSLSSFILKIKSSAKIVVDHKDENTLDNRKINLQICTTQQNVTKHIHRVNNTSGFRGVTRGRGGWQAQITYNLKSYHLGIFLDKKEAALAYNTKANELFGKYAVLNEVNL